MEDINRSEHGVVAMTMCQHLAAMLLGASCVAQAACTAATEFTPRLCTIHLPAIQRVTVERNSVNSGGQPQLFSDCNRFVLDTKSVRRFFRLAKKVEDDRGEHAVDRGPCQAEGHLRFSDGRSARWMVEQVGTGTLWIGSAPPIILYCVACDFLLFRE